MALDLCRYLKIQPGTKHVPVLMISASPDIAALSEQAGADGYIEKPFDITYLLKMVDKYTGVNDH